MAQSFSQIGPQILGGNGSRLQLFHLVQGGFKQTVVVIAIGFPGRASCNVDDHQPEFAAPLWFLQSQRHFSGIVFPLLIVSYCC